VACVFTSDGGGNGQWRRSSVVVVDNSFVFAGDSFFLAVGLFDYLCVL
jgi:hypothetical protein